MKIFILTDDIVRVESKHFIGDPLSFLIVKEPVNGWIETSSHPGVPILRFTQQHLQVKTTFASQSKGKLSRMCTLSNKVQPILSRSTYP